MTSEFSNSRISSLPSERMRGSLIFSEDFVSSATVAENHGIIVGATISRGALLGGSDSITYDPIVHSDGVLSLVFKFKTNVAGELFSNASASTGFSVEVSASLLTITFYDGTTHIVEIDATLTDGEEHVLTLSIVGSVLTVFIDDSDSVVETSYLVEANTDIVFGSGLSGTISLVRIFNNTLDVYDHLNYYNETLMSFMNKAIATYRCDSAGDDTDGDKIWDKQPTVNDLYKGDRTNSAAYPTFDTDKYNFDFVDDYISNFPSLPDDYTVSATLQHPFTITSDIRQENDSTLLTELKTSGGHYGALRNLIIHTGILTAFQLLHSEYMQLYFVARGYSEGIFARLTVEGTCKASLVLSKSLVNWTGFGNGSGAGITQTADGVTFDSATSNIAIADSTDLRLADGSIVLSGSFSNVAYPEAILIKDGNYELTIDGGTVDFNSSQLTIAPTFTGSQLAVTWKDGFKPRFFLNGEYAGSGDTVVNITSTGTSDLIIGNSSTLDTVTSSTIDNVYIGDEPLTDAEILAMHYQSKLEVSTTVESIVLQSTVGGVVVQSTVDGDPIIQSTVI